MKIKDLLTKIALCIVSVTLLILASNLADYEQIQPLNISQQQFLNPITVILQK